MRSKTDDWNSEFPLSRPAEGFLNACPTYAVPIVLKLRDWILDESASRLSEAIKWRLLCFTGRSNLCGIGAFKNWVSLTFFRGKEIPGCEDILTHGEGNTTVRTARFDSAAAMPEARTRHCLRLALEIDHLPRETTPRQPALPLELPTAFAATLAKDKTARSHFEKMSTSCRNEYCRWIGEAKREETRTARISKALERLRAGKRWS